MPLLNVAGEVTSPGYRRDTHGHIAFDEGCGGSNMNDTHIYDTTLCIFFGWFRTCAYLWLRSTPFLVYLILAQHTLLYVIVLISNCDFWEALLQVDLIDGT